MLEWVARDPLNGIIITITFFISLIAGRYMSEKKILVNHLRKKIDTRIKLIIAFSLIIAATLMKHWYIPLAIAVFSVMIATRLKIFKTFGKKIIFPLCLALFILVLQSFTYGATKINLWVFPVYREGIEYGFLIFFRVLASAAIIVVLMLTISENEMLESMRWFRVPGTMLEISSFMVRYIRSFSHEGRKLKLAQESRCGFSGICGFSKRMHDTASICGLLITRAITKSDEVYLAMISRAWKPGSYSFSSTPLHTYDKISGFFLFSVIIGLLFLDRILWS